MNKDHNRVNQTEQQGDPTSSEPQDEDPQLVLHQLQRAEEMADQLDGKLDAFLDDIGKMLSTLERAGAEGKSEKETASNDNTNTCKQSRQ